MLFYFLRRLVYMVVVLIVISVISFIIIQLPPGDFLTGRMAELGGAGTAVGEEQIIALRKRYSLDMPVYYQYFKWMWKILHGDFGLSFKYNRPVSELIAERFPLTIMVSVLVFIFTYAVAIPIGIYSATHQYSISDYFFTTTGFAGLAIPNFLFALILIILFHKYFGISVGGLFSIDYIAAPWSIGKFIDMLKHFPIPIIVIGTSQTTWLIRVMRGCLLDELNKQYVITARAKGLEERTLLFKYPVRVAINPIISNISLVFPSIISGQIITTVVLSLPTTGPLLLQALMSQDMFLAGALIMLIGFLAVIGSFLSDILLAWMNPRIRYGK